MNTVTVPATAPVPTGNVWLPTPEDPATIPVPLPVIIVAVEGPYTEQDRKLWTFLLHAVWDDLETQPVHELPVRDINLTVSPARWQAPQRLDMGVRQAPGQNDRGMARHRGR